MGLRIYLRRSAGLVCCSLLRFRFEQVGGEGLAPGSWLHLMARPNSSWQLVEMDIELIRVRLRDWSRWVSIRKLVSVFIDIVNQVTTPAHRSRYLCEEDR